MADFVSSLNGNQMDAALMDMAEHNSEAWAVGERNGVAVGTDDVAYHNNARYYAQQAQSIAPASVTEAVRWDIAQTALTDANKEQARANIDAGKNGAWSNENLLDNWYFVGGGSQLGDGIFPINQRGQTVYTTAAWNMDRWYGTCTLYSDYLHIPSFIEQNAAYPLNTPLTMSAMLADGTIVSGTATFTDRNTQQYFYTDGTNIQLVRAVNGMPMIWTGVGVDVKAVKLEVGTVSTLANDAPPDFGEELRKCQRYLRYVPLTRTPAVISGNTAVVTLNGIEMAGVPTPALISAGGARDAGGAQNITSATVTGFTYNTPTVQFALAGNLNYVIGYVYDTVVRLSCEL